MGRFKALTDKVSTRWVVPKYSLVMAAADWGIELLLFPCLGIVGRGAVKPLRAAYVMRVLVQARRFPRD